MCSYAMQNHGMMAKSVTAMYCFCLFKVDARHEYKWQDHIANLLIRWLYKHILTILNVLYVLPSVVHPLAPFCTVPGFPTLLKAYSMCPIDVTTPVIQ